MLESVGRLVMRGCTTKEELLLNLKARAHLMHTSKYYWARGLTYSVCGAVGGHQSGTMATGSRALHVDRGGH